MQTRQLAATALMAALLALCAWLTIPTVVPFTMQTFGIFLAVGLLGGKLGSLAVGVYLLLGIVGLPVFSGFSGGIGTLAGVTGGYLLGFLLIALVMWLAERLFGTGTAAVISPVGMMEYKGVDYVVNGGEMGPVTKWLYDTITGIQSGRLEDKFGWVVKL